MSKKAARKILFIISKMGKGGAQKIVADLSSGLVKAGFDVDILLLYRTPQDQFFLDTLDERVDLFFLGAKSPRIEADFRAYWKRIFHIIQLPVLVWRWISRGELARYEVVHSHLLAGSFVSWLMDLISGFLKKKRPLFIETFHTDFTSISSAERRFFLFFWRHLDVLVTELSRKDYQIIGESLPGVSVRYIPFGVEKLEAPQMSEVEDFKGGFNIKGKPIIVTIARLNNNEKRIDKLLETISSLKKKYGDEFYYLVCGDGPDITFLKKYASELGVAEQTFFVGYVDNISVPLSMANVFLVAGIEDLVGIAGLQAATSGVPVVSFQTDVNWPNEGNYFWNSKSTEHVGEKVYHILKDDDHARNLSSRCKQIADQHFSLRAMIDAYKVLYEDV